MSTELARYADRDDLPSAEVAGAINQTLQGLKAIRTFIDSEFRERVDFGKIPGCGDKATLFLPGAQKATMYFNAFPTYKVREKDLGGGHVEFRVRCLLVSRATSQQIGEGLGCASTKEKKFQRGAGGASKTRKCPSCGKDAVFKSKKEGEGFFCWRKEGGCGLTFPPNHPDMRASAAPETTNEAPYESHNTVLKMAKKRAHVDAAMTLGCLSELFTQDIEDTYTMTAVRDAAQEEPEPYHVNGEIIEEPAKPARSTGKNTHPNQSGFASGQYAEQEQADYLIEKLKEKVEAVNSDWRDFWQSPTTGEFPPGIKREFMSIHQLDNHLLKWAIDSGRLDESSTWNEGQARLLGRYTAIVLYRSAEDGRALKREINEYIKAQWEIRKDAIYRKHPELAPDGWAEEQAEDRGDAFEETVEEALTNGLTEAN